MSNFVEKSKEEVDKLNDDELFAYLDERAKYLKQFSKPLDTYHAVQFVAQTLGNELTTDELNKAKELGRVGDDKRAEELSEAAAKLGGDPKFKDPGIKNIKTNRNQWFD